MPSVEWLPLELLRSIPPPPVPWVIEGFAALGALTVFFGEPGKGKSLFSMNAAWAVAYGERILGMDTLHRKVVVLDAENGEHEIHRRLSALGFWHNLRVATVRQFDLRDHAAVIADAISPGTVGLLVVDSFRTLWSGDENDSQGTTEILEILRMLAQETHTAIVLIHHTNRAGDFRGSGAIQAVPELMVRLDGVRRDRDQQRRFLVWEKCRLGPKPRRTWLRITGTGLVEPHTKPLPGDIWTPDG